MNYIPVIVLFGGFVLLMLFGVPLAFSLFLISGIVLSVFTGLPLWQLIQRFIGGIDSFVLTAIPFFLLAGNIMNSGQISKKLIDLAYGLVGHFRGGLAQINVLDSLFFGGISGSAVADVSGLGTIIIPEMKERGYTTSYTVVITAMTSVLAQIIPPSLIMIIYASVSNASIQALFLAGIVPGILLAGTMMIVNYLYAVKYNYPRERKKPPRELLKALRSSVFILVMPLIVVVGVGAGVFTATESAVVAVVYSLLLTIFIMKTLKPKDLIPILIKTAKGSATILLCIGAATAFGHLISYFRTNILISQLMASMNLGIGGYILFVSVLFLILGCFMDAAPAITIFVPIILPAGLALGLHPTHVGMIVCLVLAIGLVTPPYGLCLLLACQIGKIEPQKTFKDLFIMLSGVLITLFIIIFLPDLILWLPRLLVPKFM